MCINLLQGQSVGFVGQCYSQRCSENGTVSVKLQNTEWMPCPTGQTIQVGAMGRVGGRVSCWMFVVRGHTISTAVENAAMQPAKLFATPLDVLQWSLFQCLKQDHSILQWHTCKRTNWRGWANILETYEYILYGVVGEINTVTGSPHGGCSGQVQLDEHTHTHTHTHTHMHSTMMMCRHTHTEHITAGMYTLNTQHKQQTSNSMYIDLHPSIETSFWLVCRKTENGQCPLTLCMNVEGLWSTRRNTVPTGHRDYV